MPVSTKLQVRRDTAANWTTTNPTLAAGEIGFETDTFKFKVGNGSTAWTSLKYSQDASLLNGTASITALTTTGDVTAGGLLKSTQSSGDEGGQIDLTKPVTNTSINTAVSIDVFQNRLRFFETGGTNRGFYLDITGGGASAGTNLVSGGSSNPTTSFAGTRRILTGYAYTPYDIDWSAIYGGGTDTYSKAYTNGTMIAIPFMMPEAATATSLSIYCAGWVASSVWRLGIYNNSASGDYPDTRLLDAGTVSTATTGVKTITISQSLSANTLYWLVAALNTGVNVTLYCAPYNALSAFMPQTTVATISTQGYFTGWSQTGVTGALPASFTATKTGFRQAPLIWVGF